MLPVMWPEFLIVSLSSEREILPAREPLLVIEDASFPDAPNEVISPSITPLLVIATAPNHSIPAELPTIVP